MDHQKLDTILFVGITAIFFIWNVFEGAIFESPYSMGLVKLYSYPIWRLALVILFFLAASWSPYVASMVGLAVFFYFEDLHKLTQTWVE
jgi:hypothetical protein